MRGESECRLREAVAGGVLNGRGGGMLQKAKPIVENLESVQLVS